MRHGKSWAALAMLIVVGCGPSKPQRNMVGYVPPTSLPAQPKQTMLSDRQASVWDNIMSYLDQSAFEIEHVDRDKGLIIALYSGNPEPYIDCGSIVTQENGALGQIAGSVQNVALNYQIDDEPVILQRALTLNSRIIIRIEEQRNGTVVSTDTNYVVTKTVNVEEGSGALREGNREVVDFDAGNRAEFSKGTACQPNGSLDLALLQSLPNVVGGWSEIDRDELPADDVTLSPDGLSFVPETESPSSSEVAAVDEPETTGDVASVEVEGLDAAVVPPAANDRSIDDAADWILPKEGLPRGVLPRQDPPAADVPVTDTSPDAAPTTDPPTAAVPQPAPVTTAAIPPEQPVEADIGISDSGSIVDQTTAALLKSFECEGVEWHYCDMVEFTAPYRKVNIDNLFGLTINTTETATSQAIGSDLQLDIDLPSFTSYLHVAYALRDGTVEHVISSPEAWPADLSHRLENTGHTMSGPQGLALFIAIASDQPLFLSAPSGREDARDYLARLRERLAEIEALGTENRITASQLLINVE